MIIANPFTEEELEKCIRDFHATDWAGTCPTITILRLFATIRKLKMDIENLITNSVGVADPPDHIETVSKEVGSLAKYDEQLQMVDKYFK